MKLINNYHAKINRRLEAGTKYEHKQATNMLAAEMRLAFIRSRAQAIYRKEGWEITWDEYQDIWEGSWGLRYNKPRTVMTRDNINYPWSYDNVILVTMNRHKRV